METLHTLGLPPWPMVQTDWPKQHVHRALWVFTGCTHISTTYTLAYTLHRRSPLEKVCSESGQWPDGIFDEEGGGDTRMLLECEERVGGRRPTVVRVWREGEGGGLWWYLVQVRWLINQWLWLLPWWGSGLWYDDKRYLFRPNVT